MNRRTTRETEMLRSARCRLVYSQQQVFIISTAHSKTATETLLEKLEKPILDAAQKLSLCSGVIA